MHACHSPTDNSASAAKELNRFFSSFETTETNITDIFNLFLTQANVPACLKSATVVLVPMQSNISTLNDNRPVARTLIITECFARLVLKPVKSTLPPDLNPDRYAYRANRSTDETITTALTCLNQKGTYVRMLFIDYSSAFNTIMPNILVYKLINLGLSSTTCTCMWIKDFLSNHPQKLLSLLWLKKLNRDSTSSEPSRKHLCTDLLKAFYLCTTESILTACMTACYPNCPDCLQRVSKTSQKIIRLWTTSSQLPSLKGQRHL